MKNNNDKWGVIQKLEVEADTQSALSAAIAIAMVEHASISHWSVGDGALHLSWSRGIELPVAITDPAKATDLVTGWLKLNNPLGPEPDTDGSVNDGFRVTCGSFYDVCAVKPIHIVYGK